MHDYLLHRPNSNVQARLMNCPFCSSPEIKAFSVIAHDVHDTGSSLSIKECLNCGLAWQFPRCRTAAESVEILSRRYAEQEQGSYCDPQKRRATAGAELAFLETFAAAPGKLLDIGAGDGTFIAQAAGRGWECIGLDPAAREDPELRSPGAGSFVLIQGTLKDLDPTQRFDAITMWDVIEHLDDPEDVLNTAVPFLKDLGILIVETGNYQSVDRIVSGPDWWAYMADHRWYFAPPTVRQLLKKFGLKYVALGPQVLRPWWHGRHSYDGPSKLRTLKKMVRYPWTALQTVRQYILLRTAAAHWDRWAGLDIFAMVASRQPIQSYRGNAGFIDLS